MEIFCQGQITSMRLILTSTGACEARNDPNKARMFRRQATNCMESERGGTV